MDFDEQKEQYVVIGKGPNSEWQIAAPFGTTSSALLSYEGAGRLRDTLRQAYNKGKVVGDYQFMAAQLILVIDTDYQKEAQP